MDDAAILEIHAVIDERIAAMRDHDAARAIAVLAPDIVAFEAAPPLSVSGEVARDLDGTQAWLESWDIGPEIEVRDLSVAVSDDVAFAYALMRLHGASRLLGQVDFWHRSTLCFRKREGRWLIVHGHSSVPLLADGSQRGALDLKPE